VPEGEEEREEETSRHRERPVREAVQAHDEHLRSEGAIEGAAEKRVREDALVRFLKPSLKMQ